MITQNPPGVLRSVPVAAVTLLKMAATRLPGTPRLLRALNDRAALELLLARGPLTRAQLGELTGLSKVTAAQLVERLEARGLVDRVGEQGGGRGPNAQLYAVVPGSAYVVGVAVGLNTIVAACADITGVIVGRAEQSTRDNDNPLVVVHRMVTQATAQAGTDLTRVRRVVLGASALVDPRTGEFSATRDLPRWHRGPLEELRRTLSVPVVFGNDVSLAAIAESSTGAARDNTDFVLVWVGRGIAQASVIDGKLHHGSTGAASLIGALPVLAAVAPGEATAALNAAKRGAKARGTFDHFAGAEAIKAIGKRYGFPGAQAVDVLRAAVSAGEAGDVVLDELAGRLAIGVAAICVVLDPPLVVLAGEISQAGGVGLAARVEREVASIAPVAPSVVVTTVSADPVLLGALRTALDAVRDEVFGATTA